VGVEGLQGRIYRSWVDEGFVVMSCHTPQEIASQPEHIEAIGQLGVNILAAESSPSPFPDYLPNLRKAFTAFLAAVSPGLIAITNADIFFSIDPESHEAFKSLPRNVFMIAHRADIVKKELLAADPQAFTSGIDYQPFYGGIDFLLVHSDLLEAALPFLADELTFGLPWWDLLLPMALIAAWGQPMHLNSLQFRHLCHDVQWNPRWFTTIGKKATSWLYEKIEPHKSSVKAYLWALGYSAITSPLQKPSKYYHQLKYGWKGIGKEPRSPLYLYDVLRLTEGIVGENCYQSDARWLSSWVPEDPWAS
jgi:hypothetical protein